MSDREGHGHKAVVYKSHFPPLRYSVVTETPVDTLANKPRLHTKTLFVLYAPTTGSYLHRNMSGYLHKETGYQYLGKTTNTFS